jgi:hypothetical protein
VILLPPSDSQQKNGIFNKRWIGDVAKNRYFHGCEDRVKSLALADLFSRSYCREQAPVYERRC